MCTNLNTALIINEAVNLASISLFANLLTLWPRVIYTNSQFPHLLSEDNHKTTLSIMRII